jgi:hypothetical protein
VHCAEASASTAAPGSSPPSSGNSSTVQQLTENTFLAALRTMLGKFSQHLTVVQKSLSMKVLRPLFGGVVEYTKEPLDNGDISAILKYSMSLFSSAISGSTVGADASGGASSKLFPPRPPAVFWDAARFVQFCRDFGVLGKFNWSMELCWATFGIFIREQSSPGSELWDTAVVPPVPIKASPEAARRLLETLMWAGHHLQQRRQQALTLPGGDKEEGEDNEEDVHAALVEEIPELVDLYYKTLTPSICAQAATISSIVSKDGTNQVSATTGAGAGASTGAGAAPPTVEDLLRYGGSAALQGLSGAQDFLRLAYFLLLGRSKTTLTTPQGAPLYEVDHATSSSVIGNSNGNNIKSAAAGAAKKRSKSSGSGKSRLDPENTGEVLLNVLCRFLSANDLIRVSTVAMQAKRSLHPRIRPVLFARAVAAPTTGTAGAATGPGTVSSFSPEGTLIAPGLGHEVVTLSYVEFEELFLRCAYLLWEASAAVRSDDGAASVAALVGQAHLKDKQQLVLPTVQFYVSACFDVRREFVAQQSEYHAKHTAQLAASASQHSNHNQQQKQVQRRKASWGTDFVSPYVRLLQALLEVPPAVSQDFDMSLQHGHWKSANAPMKLLYTLSQGDVTVRSMQEAELRRQEDRAAAAAAASSSSTSAGVSSSASSSSSSSSATTRAASSTKRKPKGSVRFNEENNLISYITSSAPVSATGLGGASGNINYSANSSGSTGGTEAGEGLSNILTSALSYSVADPAMRRAESSGNLRSAFGGVAGSGDTTGTPSVSVSGPPSSSAHAPFTSSSSSSSSSFFPPGKGDPQQQRLSKPLTIAVASSPRTGGGDRDAWDRDRDREKDREKDRESVSGSPTPKLHPSQRIILSSSERFLLMQESSEQFVVALDTLLVGTKEALWPVYATYCSCGDSLDPGKLSGPNLFTLLSKLGVLTDRTLLSDVGILLHQTATHALSDTPVGGVAALYHSGDYFGSPSLTFEEFIVFLCAFSRLRFEGVLTTPADVFNKRKGTALPLPSSDGKTPALTDEKVAGGRRTTSQLVQQHLASNGSSPPYNSAGSMNHTPENWFKQWQQFMGSSTSFWRLLTECIHPILKKQALLAFPEDARLRDRFCYVFSVEVLLAIEGAEGPLQQFFETEHRNRENSMIGEGSGGSASSSSSSGSGSGSGSKEEIEISAIVTALRRINLIPAVMDESQVLQLIRDVLPEETSKKSSGKVGTAGAAGATGSNPSPPLHKKTQYLLFPQWEWVLSVVAFQAVETAIQQSAVKTEPEVYDPFFLLFICFAYSF